jgi:hypothetical protein
MKEMVIPEAALRDPDSLEMLRVWIAERNLWCSLRIGIYKEQKNVSDERAWGVILADATRHIANALASEYAIDPAEATRRIQASFIAELAEPTSNAEGKFVPRPN